MQPKRYLRSFIKLGLCAAMALGFVCSTQAQGKANPTGTWTWTRQGRNGNEMKQSLKLKAEGDKLTGKIITPRRQGGEPNETEIKDGKIKGDEISFTVTREFNGNSFTTKYNGKVSGDTIKGKMEFERNGNSQTRDWEAKRGEK